MSERKKLTGPYTIDIKGNIIYPPASSPEIAKEVPSEDLSIDLLINKGLRSLYGIMRAIEVDVGSGAPSRETVMNLKDVMAMLKDLKKDEKELLDSLTDEKLQELVKK